MTYTIFEGDEATLGVKVFDPNQPRNPHTGEWIDTPGLPSIQLLERAGTPTPEGMADFDSTLHGSVRASFDDDEVEAINGALGKIAEAHRWPDGADAIPIRPTDAMPEGARAEFVHRGMSAREIRVAERLDRVNTLQAFVHEMGHYLDQSMSEEGVLFQSEGYPSPAMEELLRVARESVTMQAAMRLGSAAERDYLNRPREIWARAYNQWITGWPIWDDSDFREIGRAVQAVLEEQGLV